jgi:hypothetical protein
MIVSLLDSCRASDLSISLRFRDLSGMVLQSQTGRVSGAESLARRGQEKVWPANRELRTAPSTASWQASFIKSLMTGTYRALAGIEPTPYKSEYDWTSLSPSLRGRSSRFGQPSPAKRVAYLGLSLTAITWPCLLPVQHAAASTVQCFHGASFY